MPKLTQQQILEVLDAIHDQLNEETKQQVNQLRAVREKIDNDLNEGEDNLSIREFSLLLDDWNVITDQLVEIVRDNCTKEYLEQFATGRTLEECLETIRLAQPFLIPELQEKIREHESVIRLARQILRYPENSNEVQIAAAKEQLTKSTEEIKNIAELIYDRR